MGNQKSKQEVFIMNNSHDFTLVKEGIARSVIVTGINATPAEQHAAEELQSFIEKISKAKLEIISEDKVPASSAERFVLIGKPETNNLIMEVVGDIWKTTAHKFDTLLIRTSGNYLVLSGDRNRSVIYSVYHLLEKFLHVGFFWDGDSIHEMKDIIIPETDMISESSFEYRFSKSASECNETYSFTTWWNFDQWKTEIDYMMKNKMNIARIKFCSDIIQKRAYRKLGINVGEETDLEKKRLSAAKEIYDYCHILDLQIAGELPCPVVPAEFKEKYTNGRYYAEMWTAVSTDLEKLNRLPKHTLCTGSEPYAILTTAYVQEWKDYFGQADEFYVPRLPSESLMTATLDEVFDNCLKGPLDAVRKVAPNAMLSVDGWMFRFMYKDFWANGGVEKLLNSLDIKDYYILDLCTPWSGSIPLYQLNDYKWVSNRKFILSILNEFGGNNILRGCYDYLIHESKKLISDKTNGCGIGNSQEVMYFNVNYYDLINHVGWDAPNIEKARFVDDQALRRYGNDLYYENAEAFRAFIDAVYSGYNTKEARYQIRPQFGFANGNEIYCGTVNSNEPEPDHSVANKLNKYLKLSLPLSDKAKENKFLMSDIYEGLRQYITELYDIEVVLFDTAFLKNDKKAFEAHASSMLFLMDQLELLTRSNERWYLEYEARKLDGHMSINNGTEKYDSSENIRFYMRDAGTTFAASIESLIDYSRKDYHELVKYYYTPRVREGIEFMRKHLGITPEEWDKLDKSEAFNAFNEIEQNWAHNGYPAEEFDAEKPDLADTLEKVYKAISSYPVFRE